MSEMPEFQMFLFDKFDKAILRAMQTVCTSLSNKFTQVHTLKMTIIIGIASFNMSINLHFFHQLLS